MRLLLDTHALLWYALSGPQLSVSAKDLIKDSANVVHVSAATFWEIAIKISLGKLTVQQPYENFVDACLKTYAFSLLPIDPRHTARVVTLPYPGDHRDPFDRILAAQALVDDLTLVGADTAFDAYGVKRTW